MRVSDVEASDRIKKAQLRCGNCTYRQGVETINKVYMVGCLAAPNPEGRTYGLVDFEQARSCPGSKRKSFDELVARNAPPPDS